MQENTAKGFNAKQITFNHEGLARMARGMRKLTKLVRMTYGPAGSNVVMARQFDSPMIINEAQTICKGFHLGDHYENMGVQFLQEGLLKVKKTAGGGSTTTAILLEEMIAAGIKHLASGHNPMLVRKGMERCTKAVVKCLDQYAREMKINPDVKHLARITAMNEEIAALIQQAVNELGRQCIITVEESKTWNSEMDLQDGICLDRGFVSNLMAKDTVRMETELEEPYIFLTDQKLTSHTDVLPILEQIHRANGSLLMIADSIEGPALSALSANAVKGAIQVAAIQAPDYGDYRKALLEDLSAMTGGIVFNKNVHGNMLLDFYGRAKRIVVTKNSTQIYGAQRQEQQIKVRIQQVKAELESHTSQYDREKLEIRLGNLMGKTAVIRVGAVTDVEISDLLQKTENAIHAVKSGLKYGIVSGGGSAYIRAMSEVSNEFGAQAAGDEWVGARIVLQALIQPARQLLENAGASEALIHEVIGCYQAEGNSRGYDVVAEQWVDLFEEGLIDCCQTVKISLEVASSLAASLLTSDAAVTDAIAFPH